MIKVATMQPKYGLCNKVFVRQNMMMQDDTLSIVRAIRKSEDDIKNGRLIPADEVFEGLRKKYGY